MDGLQVLGGLTALQSLTLNLRGCSQLSDNLRDEFFESQADLVAALGA